MQYGTWTSKTSFLQLRTAEETCYIFESLFYFWKLVPCCPPSLERKNQSHLRANEMQSGGRTDGRSDGNVQLEQLQVISNNNCLYNQWWPKAYPKAHCESPICNLHFEQWELKRNEQTFVEPSVSKSYLPRLTVNRWSSISIRNNDKYYHTVIYHCLSAGNHPQD